MSTLQQILDHKLIAIIRGATPKDTLKIVQSLYEGGIRVVEITMNSPKALTSIERVVDEFGDKMAIGAGTVLDAESARSALLAGAQFILSPTYKEETIRMTKRYGAVSIPAAFTPTEILEAYESGGDIIKVFPATTLGPKFIKDIHGPLPQIPLLPTGGVDLNNVKEYLVAGAAGLGIGSSLVNTKKTINEEYLLELTEKSNKFTMLAQNY
ncbi:bifunctional 4-hydroxy-2-oxoglutarate aldolase/2-dehydro-3-deoxy-phosphogluconate aldolase [Niallia sp. FSL W8-0635]|uniref:bifunctional 4-hydroxy-2-oxoglutarate aldolase/2-dehydro-3-deoxy-phosphogluconate aldolase n=1 Tax=Niallia sp. FSL W8-0635 TaxID=2975337 RepID=UPI0030FB051E